MFDIKDITDQELHRTGMDSLERRIMELALSRTGAENGAIFLYDTKAKGLAIHFHFVAGLIVTLPDAILKARRDGRPNGIAMWVHSTNEPYLCRDTSSDPNYARYFQDVASIAAVPIPYQRRAIGVISVSSKRTDDFD
ncbi:MAG: GAF domain-containing protein, partial [Deltaproteobacteria bacterium]|nr:GAF domain-containing protein [Deltaproteobacteria bacterium]